MTIYTSKESGRSREEGQHFAEVVTERRGGEDTVHHATGFYRSETEAYAAAKAWLDSHRAKAKGEARS